MPQIEATPSFVRNVYATMAKNLDVMKARLNRPLTLAEKILYGHLHDAKGADLTRGEAYTEFKPDRVILQDATAQMAILQFMQAKKDEAAVPVTIHCDHLIRAHKGPIAIWVWPIKKMKKCTIFCTPQASVMALASGSRAQGLFTRWH